MATTPKGIWYPGPNEPNNISAHLQSVAEYNDANPGIANLTEPERDALTGTQLWDGRVVFNVDAGYLEVYRAATTSWGAVVAGTVDATTATLIQSGESATAAALSASTGSQFDDRLNGVGVQRDSLALYNSVLVSTAPVRLRYIDPDRLETLVACDSGSDVQLVLTNSDSNTAPSFASPTTITVGQEAVITGTYSLWAQTASGTARVNLKTTLTRQEAAL